MPLKPVGSALGVCRLLCCLLALLPLSGAVRRAAAQQPAVAPNAANAFNARIGNAVVVLTGPWKFHPGDNLDWAEPGFDDSGWSTLDLTPPAGSYDPVTGSSGFVPGWTSHGFPHLTGYAWYRLRIQLDHRGSESAPLALTLPMNFDDAYQVFIDGQLVGQFGRFGRNDVTFYNSQPASFAVPAGIRNGPVTIAIRFWMDFDTPLQSPDAGGLHGPPIIGEASAIDAMLKLEWDAVGRTQVGNLLAGSFLLLAAVLGLTLFWFDRSEPAYLWLGLACALGVTERAAVMTGYYSLAVAMVPENFFIDVISRPTSLALWALFWAHWFELEEMRRIKRVAVILSASLVVGMALLRPPLFGRAVPVQAEDFLLPLTLVLKLLLGALLLWITYRGIRKQTTDGWLALAPILLSIFWTYQEELGVIHVPTILRFAGLTITVGVIATLLMLAIVSVLLMRRFVRGQRERELWRLEIEQARQVQQVLIPEDLPTIPGFRLASEYRPAQQVGGDFFQIMPTRGGGVLAVIGDVSGKGMPAAMTVSLLVGTLRTLAHFTDSPGDMISAMNVRMLARSHGGFTTCLVMRVAADGAVTIANAGHLSPYLEGKEMTVESGLPLGLSADAKYVESAFRLAQDQQLTLVSDGVVEARGHAGELFGFERTAAIAAQSAESIAAAAQQFGQSDDITVLTLMRVSAHEESATRVATSVLTLAE